MPSDARAGSRRQWVPGTAAALGFATGAAAGSTITDDLALAAGMGLVLGAMIDLGQLVGSRG